MFATDDAARIAEAQAAIRTALLAGENTAPHRAKLRAAEAEAARAVDAVRKIEATHQREQAAAIAAAAEALATAEQQHAAAAAAVAAAETERDKVAGRIQALDAARAEIVMRRQAGDMRPDDGATLELHAADREGLVPLLAERNASVAAARSAAQHAKGQIDAARIAFTRLEAKRAETALCERAEQLGQLLSNTIDALRGERDRLGGGQLAWTPSRALMDRLVPLDLGRAW
jgi:hypothetical protein